MSSVKTTLTGFDFLEAFKSELTSSAYKSALRKAVKSGASIIQSAFERTTPVKTGGMKNSINTRMRVYSRSLTVVSITGVDSKYKEWKYQPSKIVGLVEKGHKLVKGGSLSRTVKGKNGKEYHYAQSGSPRVIGFVKGVFFVRDIHKSLSRVVLDMIRQNAIKNCINAFKRAARRAEKNKKVVK